MALDDQSYASMRDYESRCERLLDRTKSNYFGSINSLPQLSHLPVSYAQGLPEVRASRLSSTRGQSTVVVEAGLETWDAATSASSPSSLSSLPPSLASSLSERGSGCGGRGGGQSPNAFTVVRLRGGAVCLCHQHAGGAEASCLTVTIYMLHRQESVCMDLPLPTLDKTTSKLRRLFFTALADYVVVHSAGMTARFVDCSANRRRCVCLAFEGPTLVPIVSTQELLASCSRSVAGSTLGQATRSAATHFGAAFEPETEAMRDAQKNRGRALAELEFGPDPSESGPSAHLDVDTQLGTPHHMHLVTLPWLDEVPPEQEPNRNNGAQKCRWGVDCFAFALDCESGCTFRIYINADKLVTVAAASLALIAPPLTKQRDSTFAGENFGGGIASGNVDGEYTDITGMGPLITPIGAHSATSNSLAFTTAVAQTPAVVRWSFQSAAERRQPSFSGKIDEAAATVAFLPVSDSTRLTDPYPLLREKLIRNLLQMAWLHLGDGTLAQAIIRALLRADHGAHDANAPVR